MQHPRAQLRLSLFSAALSAAASSDAVYDHRASEPASDRVSDVWLGDAFVPLVDVADAHDRGGWLSLLGGDGVGVGVGGEEEATVPALLLVRVSYVASPVAVLFGRLCRLFVVEVFNLIQMSSFLASCEDASLSDEPCVAEGQVEICRRVACLPVSEMFSAASCLLSGKTCGKLLPFV